MTDVGRAYFLGVLMGALTMGSFWFANRKPSESIYHLEVYSCDGTMIGSGQTEDKKTFEDLKEQIHDKFVKRNAADEMVTSIEGASTCKCRLGDKEVWCCPL